MEELLKFLETYELWIYGLLGVIAVIYLRRLIIAWDLWRGTVFGLERESAQLRLTTSLTIVVLLCLFILGEFVIVSFVVPAYPKKSSLPTPTLNVLATPTVTLLPGSVPTPTRAALVPVPSEADTEGCEPGKIEWTSPLNGQEIKGSIELKGTVNIPNLGFYKYEFSQPNSKTWTTIAAGNTPKVNGQIGFWNTTQLVAGDYMLRLVAVDNKNQMLPACVITVRVVTK